MAAFKLDKKLVVQVRYYEHLYVITDEFGGRVYTGTDEKVAKLILKTLTMYRLRESRRRPKPRPRKRAKRKPLRK